MATFTRHYPNDSDPAIGFATLTTLLGTIAANISPAFIGTAPINKGETIGDYRWIQWTQSASPAGEAPYIEYRMQQTAAPSDIVAMRFHFNNALKGNLDPILAFDPSVGMFDGKPDAATADFIQSISSLILRDYIQGFAPALSAAGLLSGTFSSNVATVITGTDGVRAGKIIGVGHRLQYDPTASEFTIGINALAGYLFYPVVFGGTDGHNILGATSVGTNVGIEQVPQVIVQQGSSITEWESLTQSVSTVATEINQYNFTSNTVVTATTDLGAPSPDANEPNPVDVTVEVYGKPGALPALIANPGAIANLTTWPGLALTFFGAAATLFSDLFTKSVPALLQANLPSLGDLGQLVRIANALEGIEQTHQTLDTNLAVLTTQAERLCNLLGSPPGDPDDDAHTLNAITDLTEKIRLLAETRQELVLRAKGIEVEAFTGSVFEEPPP